MGTLTAAAVLLLTSECSVVHAYNSEDTIGISIGASVTVSVVASMLTTLVTYLCIAKCKKYCRKSNINRSPKRESKQSYRSDHTADTELSLPARSVPLQATHAHPQVKYQPVNQRPELYRDSVTANGNLRTRRVRDFVSEWCTNNNLTEEIANILREAGYNSKDAICSLHIDDLDCLPLQNVAQRSLLRKAIHRPNDRKRANSVTDDVSPSSRHPSENSNSLDKSKSLQSLEHELPPARTGLQKKKSNIDIFDTPDGVILSIPNAQPHNLYKSPQETRQPTGNPKGFQGILSDTGLYDRLARHIGSEYYRLAALLGVPNHVVEQLAIDIPHNVTRQTMMMLRIFRDNEDGSKEQIKGKLHDALVRVGRNDLAQEILQEQVDGSVEKFHRQTSVI